LLFLRSKFDRMQDVWFALLQLPPGGLCCNLPKACYTFFINSRKGVLMAQINWITDFDEGLARGRGEGKLVFADFFNPG